MKCNVCGMENSPGASFCVNCGQPLMGDDMVVEQPVEVVNNVGAFSGNEPVGNPEVVYTGAEKTIGPMMTKKELFDMPEFNQANSTINGWTIFLIIMGVINTIYELSIAFVPIDGILMLVLGIVLRKTKSLGAAIGVLILGIISLVVGIYTTGRPVGLLYVIGGAILCSVASKLKNSYNKYLETGEISFE
ncbi:zinc ribbon domain-containing protein [Butyrivibrio sp. INlla21]|uniref:zinc ribbon domain-containing protein n=1 Tax=Butyrivibrio sp. INlla21 TaxID=1520811 RepID=UPI0008EE30B2|nr:zinc ribbon domain-containing protein [Butyrivibrio sp. INlla21]SFU99928.1 hypothetical protein SAMN02910342_02857 [Butyrivibrio sp. INlla21]